VLPTTPLMPIGKVDYQRLAAIARELVV